MKAFLDDDLVELFEQVVELPELPEPNLRATGRLSRSDGPGGTISGHRLFVKRASPGPATLEGPTL